MADSPGAQSPVRATLRRLVRHRLFVSGLVLFAVVLVLAALAPWITTADPTKLSIRTKFRPPSWEFVFGTDNLGRSLWSRTVWGARLSVEIGMAVVVLNAVFGTMVGALAGYFRRVDGPLMRVNDALMAFPAILLAIGITAVLGPSTENVILALAVVYIPRTARIVRASVLVLREMEYVQAAVAAGAGHWRILRTHVLPNAMAPLFSVRLCGADRGDAELSWPGRGAADAHLGQHHGRGAAVYAGGAVDHHHPWPAADGDGDGVESFGRWVAGCLGPPAAFAAMTDHLRLQP
jgi:peptide/nickel transport system permease protein